MIRYQPSGFDARENERLVKAIRKFPTQDRRTGTVSIEAIRFIRQLRQAASASPPRWTQLVEGQGMGPRLIAGPGTHPASGGAACASTRIPILRFSAFTTAPPETRGGDSEMVLRRGIDGTAAFALAAPCEA